MTIVFDSSEAVHLPDRDYFDFTLASIEAARRRVWVSMFIFDIRPSRDIRGNVLDLALALIERRTVGVDIRVLTTGSVGTPDIAVANLASGIYLENSGVPHRRVMSSGKGRKGSHAKFVVCDDIAIVGSQNWTDDGFSLNHEDALIAIGKASEQLGQEFLRLWSIGSGLPNAAQ